MFAEHRQIVRGARRSRGCGEGREVTEYAHLAERLISHARTEEEFLCPAALLGDRYLKLRLGK